MTDAKSTVISIHISGVEYDALVDALTHQLRIGGWRSVEMGPLSQLFALVAAGRESTKANDFFVEFRKAMTTEATDDNQQTV